MTYMFPGELPDLLRSAPRVIIEVKYVETRDQDVEPSFGRIAPGNMLR